MPSAKSPVFRILDLVQLEKKEITAVYFYSILNALIQLSVPLGIQAIVGFVLGASMRASLYVLIILVVLAVFVAGIMQKNQMKIIEKIQQKIFVRYAFAFADHIPKMDMKKADQLYLPELVNRFFDVPVLQKSLSKIFLDIPTATVQILFGLILLSLYHPAFIFFGIVLIIVLWLILRFSGHHGLQTSLEESTYKYKVAGWLEEIARIIRSIKLTKTNDLHLQKTDEYVSKYLDARNKHFKVLLFQYNALILFKTVITAAMLIVGTILLVNQQLNIGQFIASEIVILLVLNSVEKLIINLGTFYDALTAVEKLSSLTDTPEEENGSIALPALKKGLKLEMKNLSFGYSNGKIIIEDVSFQINPGEKVCVMGKASSGKSTLIRVMAGVYTDFNGSFLMDDLPICNYDLASVRLQSGVLMNQLDIFQGSLWENISLGNDHISREKVIVYAEKTGLNEFISTLKNGFDTMLEPTGKRLPRNVVQKILLVRALAAEPRLLLLEEPWTNFENVQRTQIIGLLNEIKNTTIVIVTNDDEFARQCDKIIYIDEGKAITTKNVA